MRNRIFLKLLVLGGISILLLLALSSIGGIARERKQRLHGVQRNIAESYAGPQRITGPVFLIEYRERWTGKLYNKEKESWYEKEMDAARTATVFPEQLNYAGLLQVQERYRGIYKANVFQSVGRIEGSVELPALERLRKEQASSIELVSAKACLLISDPRGISHVPAFEWDGQALDVLPGSGLKADGKGVHADLPDLETLDGLEVAFALDLDIHGMGRFEFVPIGSDNHVQLESAWPHPSFIGDFLAVDRAVSSEGFVAEWSVNELACSAQQDMVAGKPAQMQRFGVELVDPVNPYPMTDRALKYGFLFVFITFAAFFLFELVKELRIHPIQYGFVGLAQALFFLLLLSLSEHIGFGLSYLIASAATIDVITIYLCSALKGFKRGIFFGVVLAALYGALYALLQSEDHALLAGSTLLFGLTALVMMLTRKLDWYALASRQGE
ncbi:MAG: cell envelope integrity protein CreD [Verrucomicrobiota bacterium]